MYYSVFPVYFPVSSVIYTFILRKSPFYFRFQKQHRYFFHKYLTKTSFKRLMLHYEYFMMHFVSDYINISKYRAMKVQLIAMEIIEGS